MQLRRIQTFSNGDRRVTQLIGRGYGQKFYCRSNTKACRNKHSVDPELPAFRGWRRSGKVVGLHDGNLKEAPPRPSRSQWLHLHHRNNAVSERQWLISHLYATAADTNFSNGDRPVTQPIPHFALCDEFVQQQSCIR